MVSGLTAVNALSTYFSISSTRLGETAVLKSKRGRDVEFVVSKTTNKNSKGTTVMFEPIKKYLEMQNLESKKSKR